MSLSAPAAVLGLLPCPAFLTDPAGRLVSVNPPGSKELPWLLEGGEGLWLHSIAGPEDRPFLKAYLDSWISETCPTDAPTHESHRVALRGRPFEVTPIWQESGMLVGHVWRLLALGSRPHSGEQLEVIVDSINDAIISIDEDFRVAFLNRAAELSFGCNARHAIGQHMDLFPSLATALKQLNLGTLSTNRDLFKAAHQLEGRRANGETFPMEATLSGALIGGRQYYTAVIRDISVQMQMEQALYQSQKSQAIGALASGVAHDFNNILTAILSHLDLVAYSRDLPGSLRESVVLAQNSARRGAELVNKLLTFSRNSEFRPTRIDVNHLVEEVLVMLRRSINPLIQIHHFTDDASAWPVRADNSQLMQVVMNLCLNARDAMPNGGNLTIRVSLVHISGNASKQPKRVGDFVRLSIQDNGEGMHSDVLNRLGEPYFTTKEPGKGTGLGLSIAFSVVEEHHGWIDVESAPGNGTQFHVHLPLCKQVDSVASVEVAGIESMSEGALSGTETVLIVDDDEIIRLVVRAVLTYRGYRVHEAVHGEDAIRRFDELKESCDLVLLDLHMPRVNGWDVLRHVRLHAPGIPVIIMSGGATDGDYTKASELGAASFMRKPFENRELTRAVRKVLDRKRTPENRLHSGSALLR